MNGEFGEGRPDDEAIADAGRWGLPEEEIEALRAALGMPAGERLWAMHARAFAALCAAGTQWRQRLVFTDHGLRAFVAGLDYAAVKVALDMLQISLMPEDWRQLTVLESEAVRTLNGEPAS